MNILQIDGGKLELRSDRGSYIRTICYKDVVDADLSRDGSLIVITLCNGKVEVRKENGSYVRTIVHKDAVSARWNGNDIAVRLTNGKTELRKENGSYIRTIQQILYRLNRIK